MYIYEMSNVYIYIIYIFLFAIFLYAIYLLYNISFIHTTTTTYFYFYFCYCRARALLRTHTRFLSFLPFYTTLYYILYNICTYIPLHINIAYIFFYFLFQIYILYVTIFIISKTAHQHLMFLKMFLWFIILL